MWPWEHAIVGYVAYSLFCHIYYRDSPGGLEAFAAVFASVLPDLIDKPLSWEFGVFEAGYAIGHSIFFAIPLAIVVGIGTRSVGRSRTGIAFGLAYLLHLPSDVFDAYVREDVVHYELMLWPVATVADGGHGHGFLEQFSILFDQYQAELFSSDPSTYLWGQLGLGVFAGLLWLYDGAPVARDLVVGGFKVFTGLLKRVDG
ncbi:metal-dependent hydrolase [Halostagnicola sp. A-GB9-2]|uniref:metal-dependent hydrolase n=1 Tax=Halostagnicola sp. A-GB9-2 TaxID=3048066 RepID=UPI0024BF464B|nr:metal-dependent hydrolase [Halostagnicola sp. A-GB9-2]MDJ1434488.1 metal-dependent hydrolase [Halostagnicola sp. A-GB9-2]